MFGHQRAAMQDSEILSNKVSSWDYILKFHNSACVLLEYAFTISQEKHIFHFSIGKMNLNSELPEAWIDGVLIYRHVYNNRINSFLKNLSHLS